MTSHGRTWGLVLGLLAVLAFMSSTTVGFVLGLALLMALVGLLLPIPVRIDSLFGNIVLREGLGPIALASITAVLFSPLLAGNMPQSADHPVHLTRAWHFLTQNLLEGQLSGWSDYWFAGWPSGEDYPPLGDYWYGLWYLLSGGMLGWEGTYAVSFLTMMLTCVLCLYWFGRSHWSPMVGFLIGLFFLTDAGAYREGGWNYTVHWGVWPQVFSTGICFGAFASFRLLQTKKTIVAFVLVTGLVGLSMLAHPMALVVYLVGVPLWLLAAYFASCQNGRDVLVLIPIACLLGLLLAGYWWLPFASKGSWMAKYGELWLSLPEMGKRIWAGTLFSGTTPVILWMSIVGAMVGIWRRHGGTIFAVLFSSVMLLIASQTLFHELDLLSLAGSFGQIQFQRFVIPVKPIIFAMAGAAIYWGVQWIPHQPDAFRERPSTRRALRWGVFSLFLLPFLLSLGSSWYGAYGKGVGVVVTADEQAHREDYEAFLAWSRALPANDEFYRIAYVRPYNDHMFAAAPVFNGIPAYKVGFTPCTNFKHKPDKAESGIYQKLSVKYVVSHGALKASGLKQIRTFGKIHVYRFEDYASQRFTLAGNGEVTKAEVTPHRERMHFEFAGTGENSSLVVHVAPFPNWVARDESGREVEITSVAFSEKGAFMEVPVDGTSVTFTYVPLFIDTFTAWLSFGCLIVCLLLVALPRSRTRRMESAVVSALHGTPLIRDALWIPVGGVLGAIVMTLILLMPRAEESFATQVESAVVWVEGANGERIPCPQDNAGQHICSEKVWNQVGRREIRVGGALRRCVWAHPTQKGDLHVSFKDVTFGDVLRGNHGLADRSFGKKKLHGSTRVRVLINDDEIAKLTPSREKEWQQFEIDTTSYSGTVGTLTWVVRAQRTGKQHYCFDGSASLNSSDSQLETFKEKTR